MQPRMQVSQVPTKIDPKDLIGCPCGGIALIFNAAYLPDNQMTLGVQEIGAAVTLICNQCGELVEGPFRRRREIKGEGDKNV